MHLGSFQYNVVVHSVGGVHNSAVRCMSLEFSAQKQIYNQKLIISSKQLICTCTFQYSYGSVVINAFLRIYFDVVNSYTHVLYLPFLPGDGPSYALSRVPAMEVSTLPAELWRLILAYLPLADLGRCCVVCHAWRELILSLDSTRWRQLCLSLPEWRHPNWPRRPHLAPPSWREALRQQAVASRTWAQSGAELHSSTCLHLFRRRKDRKVWHVGSVPGHGYETLRGALAIAGPYDRLLLHPGIYEEQAEVTLKVPVEIVGMGKLGDVALLVSFDQQCPTARLCNLVLMPAWFSPVVYKVSKYTHTWASFQYDIPK